MDSLSERVLAGNRNAISRSISHIENKDNECSRLIRNLYQHTGGAFVIGITGPLGTGKSMLVDRLIRAYRMTGKKVAVLAIDPSSPISGGAILGDRLRMLDHSLDKFVYIRSMAAKGSAGGLAKSTRNAVRVLDAAGFDIIFIETTGIGQTEIDVARVADCIVVVSMPELGDEVQAFKAGLMEIGDIFVVNKSDLAGSDRILSHIRMSLTNKNGWKQIAMKVSAKSSVGIQDLLAALEKFRAQPISEFSRRFIERLSNELIENVVEEVSENIRTALANDRDFRLLLDRLLRKKIDPDSAKRLLLKKYTSNMKFASS